MKYSSWPVEAVKGAKTLQRAARQGPARATLVEAVEKLQDYKFRIGKAASQGDQLQAHRLVKRAKGYVDVAASYEPYEQGPQMLSLVRPLLNFYHGLTSKGTCAFDAAKMALGIDDLVLDVLLASGVLETTGGERVYARHVHMYAAFAEGKGYVHELVDELSGRILRGIFGAEAVQRQASVSRKVMATAEKYLDSFGSLGLVEVVGARNGQHLLVYPLKKEKELVELFEGWITNFTERESSRSVPLAKSA